MKVLIVGASGHLGANLARVLLREGFTVRALVRPSSHTQGLNGLDLEVVHGDVRDPASLAAGMSGCQAVFHLGAPTTVVPQLERIVVEGTRNVVEQAQRLRLEKVILTSSIATVGYSATPDVLLDETVNQRTPATPYHTAKWQAEREALAFERRSGLPLVVVNPATVVGPFDYRPTPSNLPIQRGLERGLPFAFGGGLTVVHAEDVARGHLLALQRGRSGERYILGGDRVTVPAYFQLICELCGRRGPYATLPRAGLLGMGACFSLLQRVGFRTVPFTFTQAAHLAGKYGWYSSQKAVEELGYSWRPVREAVAGYIDWVRARDGAGADAGLSVPRAA